MKVIHDFSLYSDWSLHNDIYDVCELCSKRGIDEMADYMVSGDYYSHEKNDEICHECSIGHQASEMYCQGSKYICEGCYGKYVHKHNLKHHMLSNYRKSHCED
jgi:hypothetical protein